MAVTLPAEFADLQPFAEKWALPVEYDRARARRESTSEELQSFYDAMFARIKDVLAALDEFPLGKIPETHRPLMHMALSLAEIAPHVELYALQPDVPYAFGEDRLSGAHSGFPD